MSADNTPIKKKIWYPRVIGGVFLGFLLLTCCMVLPDFFGAQLFETIYHGISSPAGVAISWLFIIARGISFPSYLARLKDYWHNPDHRVEKWGIIFSIITTTVLTILFFIYRVSFFSFSPLGSIGSGILYSFFFASQFIGLIPRLCRSFDKPLTTPICSINLKNENLAIVCSAIAAIAFVIIMAAAINLFSGGPGTLLAIFSIFSFIGMTVSSASYIGRCFDLYTTKTLFDWMFNWNNAKSEARKWNAESKGMVTGMVLGPAIAAILVWVVAISIPLSGGFGALAIPLFLFGNIGVGGAFGARMGSVIGWLWKGDAACDSPVGSQAEPVPQDDAGLEAGENPAPSPRDDVQVNDGVQAEDKTTARWLKNRGSSSASASPGSQAAAMYGYRAQPPAHPSLFSGPAPVCVLA